METSPNILEEPYLVTTDQDRDAITALHSICFGTAEWPKLEIALEDENCFVLLGGCDEDGQPAGYQIGRVVGKEAEGMYTGVRPERRGGGWGRKLMASAMKEARARGAETIDGQIADNNVAALQTSKSIGYVIVDSNLDWTIDNNGKRVEFTNYHIRASLMTI